MQKMGWFRVVRGHKVNGNVTKHQKTRVPGISCGVVCMILRFAVLVELRLVTDTDRRTQAHG